MSLLTPNIAVMESVAFGGLASEVEPMLEPCDSPRRLPTSYVACPVSVHAGPGPARDPPAPNVDDLVV